MIKFESRAAVEDELLASLVQQAFRGELTND